MARLTWKEGTMLSIETRKGVFALAQMIKSPYLAFFDIFSEQINFKDAPLDNKRLLFCSAVTKQFLKSSNIMKLKGVAPEQNLNIPKYWIKIFPGSRDTVVFQGTDKERNLAVLGEVPGGQLIEQNIENGGFQSESVVLDTIPTDDDKTIAQYETTSLGVHPELNERLYLCYLNDKNVDPMKLIYFDKDLPLAYTSYVYAITNDAKKLGY
ncbi:hypothetical protein OOZ15_03900 [Galbibacter sp. EGI 63066]|uniref:hypothetical protein n=1 Tax=Galbibacter sp. EGI 63066 TaxID=2993559 RepID=UPI0022488895|nr:hypothetical protein [Galbibacter sp. EGI 63066]MCX2679075.1 hypothetical protein [Galbibacter sp. EGI 63066]